MPTEERKAKHIICQERKAKGLCVFCGKNPIGKKLHSVCDDDSCDEFKP